MTMTLHKDITELIGRTPLVRLNRLSPAGGVGGDRLHHFRVALGSLREVGAVLDIAAAHGWLDEPPLSRERDRLCGMLYSLQRR